ncbi:MAG: hypothetical protein WD556_08715 [Actinomycetota bacterium]
MSVSVARRPGVVTFIGIILYIQAILAVVAGVVMLAFKDRISDALEQGATALSNDSVLVSGIVELVVAVLLFAVAAGIMRGSRGWRTFVGVVEAIRMASALFLMIWHHSGGIVSSGFVTILIGVFVLWALYVHPASEEYFESS